MFIETISISVFNKKANLGFASLAEIIIKVTQRDGLQLGQLQTSQGINLTFLLRVDRGKHIPNDYCHIK